MNNQFFNAPSPTHCGNCVKFIAERNRNIKCDLCSKFYHVKCSISTNDFRTLIAKNIGWICLPCRNEIFPFTSLFNDDLVHFNTDNPNFPTPPINMKCGSCPRKIKRNCPYAFCKKCSNYFHLKCSDLPKNKDLQEWNCSKCLIESLPFSNIDQNNLILTLHGNNNEESAFLNHGPSFTLKSLIDKLPGERFDKDDFLDDNIQSKYYTVGEFINEKFSPNKFSIIHLNIASLQLHIDELRSLLYGLKLKFDIICISESRLFDDKPLVNIDIDGYHFVHTPTATRAGGVGMYINSQLDFNILNSLSLCHPNVSESIFVEIKHPTKKNIIVGTIYRHHTAVSEFLDTYLRQTLQKIAKTNKTCILAGDFNVNLINYGENHHVDTFYDEISSFSFRPLVLQPSRVTSKSCTLIDNIFVNDLSTFSSGGNITCSISDHFSQFCQIDIFRKNNVSNKVKYSRDWRNFNKERFAYEIQNLTWSDVTSPIINANSSLSNFENKITNLLDEMAPYKRLTKKEKGLVERPWITRDISNLMSTRDNCLKDYLKENDEDLKLTKFNTYKQKRNMVTSLIRLSKKKYYSDFFLENQSNIKKTWEEIRSLLNVTKKSNVQINKLSHNNVVYTDPSKMANVMNDFYVNIGNSIEDKIPQGSKPPLHYMGEPNRYCITLNPCSYAEITSFIDKLNISKASGPFSLPSNILKTYKDVFLEPLTSIVNKSLFEGTFPSLLKTASVIPIYKKNDKDKCANYRPISLLSNISKHF